MRASPRTSAGEARIAGWLGRRGSALCLAWGAAEATLLFIVPDVAVGAVALFLPRRWWRAAAWAIGGALVGGLALYVASRLAGPPMLEVIDGVPGVPASMIERVRAELSAHGGAALVIAPLSGIPYKVYAAEMALRAWNPVSLLLWTVPARAVRIVPAALLAGGAGWLLRRWIARRPGLALGLYLAAWAAVYVAYFRANGL